MDKREIMTRTAERWISSSNASFGSLINGMTQLEDIADAIIEATPECDSNVSTFTDGGTSYGNPPLAADVEDALQVLGEPYDDDEPAHTYAEFDHAITTIRAALEAKSLAESKRVEVPEDIAKLIRSLIVERAFTLGNSHSPQVKPVTDWLDEQESDYGRRSGPEDRRKS